MPLLTEHAPWASPDPVVLNKEHRTLHHQQFQPVDVLKSGWNSGRHTADPAQSQAKTNRQPISIFHIEMKHCPSCGILGPAPKSECLQLRNGDTPKILLSIDRNPSPLTNLAVYGAPHPTAVVFSLNEIARDTYVWRGGQTWALKNSVLMMCLGGSARPTISASHSADKMTPRVFLTSHQSEEEYLPTTAPHIPLPTFSLAPHQSTSPPHHHHHHPIRRPHLPLLHQFLRQPHRDPPHHCNPLQLRTFRSSVALLPKG
mmetsp:Transcript_32986/g.55607  ORF Transcript_32986/g.55607 Transcript_32986/m.55607 type:complete len:258 (-) Transcript_32986:1345-2118(-)